MILWDIFDAREGLPTDNPTPSGTQFRPSGFIALPSMRGYHHIAASQLIGCHPEW
ncbi:hypothetical protein [uncultured Duncaniella sp.]|uniref:hypothetical protein n=1 Tax=uncultured Duncaniella sp. TaxID=2768039 RepID=UPI002606BE9E|nr:hypothetical protein [uncultured Duncaniella sp.]